MRWQHFLTNVFVSARRVWWSTRLAYGSRRVTIILLRTMNWWSSLNWTATQRNDPVAQDVSVIATDATSEQNASEWRKTFLFLGQCFICFRLPIHSFWVTFCCPTTDFQSSEVFLQATKGIQHRSFLPFHLQIKQTIYWNNLCSHKLGYMKLYISDSDEMSLLIVQVGSLEGYSQSWAF